MTDGQRLYEHENPSHIEVVLKSDVFRQNPFWVPNPKEPTPWRFFSQKTKDAWEQKAIGHNFFSGEEQRVQFERLRQLKLSQEKT